MKLLRWLGRLIVKKPSNSIFLLLLTLAIGGWVVYINVNRDGVVTGLVVDQTGSPVSGATVVIREKTLNYTFPPIETTTDYRGIYTFRDIDMIEFIIEAEKQRYGESEKRRYHLYFRGQHFEVPEALQLVPETSTGRAGSRGKGRG
jgi:hypothetical protein